MQFTRRTPDPARVGHDADRRRANQPRHARREAHKHNLPARLFPSQTDYDLIRECPLPLLIVKGSSRNSRGPVLAASDPWHINDKPKALDDRIIDAALAIAHRLGAALHAAHVYSPLRPH